MTKPIYDGAFNIRDLSGVELGRIEPVDFMRLLRTIWYGKLAIVLTTLLALLAAGYYAFGIAQPRFAATATMQIDTTAGPAKEAGQGMTGQPTDQISINTEMAILRSDHLLAQVVDALDLTKDPEFNRYLTPASALSRTGLQNRLRALVTGQPPVAPDPSAMRDRTIQTLGVAITAAAQRNTYLFEITATTSTPDKSALIANTLAQIYLTDQVTAKHAAAETTVTWLSERVYALQLQLEARETAVNDLIASARVQDDAVLDALSRQLIETDRRLSETRAELAELQKSGATVQPAANRAGAANTQRLTSQVAALEVFQASLSNQIADQSAGLVRLQQLRREADATRVLYGTFLARLQETSIRRGLQNPDSRVLTNAGRGRHVAPRKMLILAIAALLGAVSSIMIVLTRNAMRSGFTDASALTDTTGMQVMAQIPKMPLRRRAQLLNYLNDKPSSAAAEALRNLRTSLLLADKAQPPQVILSTSSIPGEGKTTQSIALAHNLANLGKKVLLIEADLRKGAFSTYFMTDTQTGLADVLAGRAALTQAVTHDAALGADVLAAQKTHQNPGDLFSGAAFARFVTGLREQYDYVVLDAPPVLPVPDARLLAQHADAVLYSVHWNTTPRHVVRAGLQELDGADIAVIGMVLAQIDSRKMRQYGGTYFANYGQGYYQ